MRSIATISAAVSLCALLASPAQAAGPSSLDVASTFPKGMPFLGEGAENLARLVEEVSGGEITLNVHGGGDIVPALEVFNAVSTGAVPAGWDWIGYWAGTIPATAVAGALPFGPPPEIFLGWMWEGGGLEIIQKAYDEHNVQLLPCHLTAPEPAGWFQKEINTPEDLKGLRFRISGLGGKVLNELGASTQLIPGGEIYVALERGRIDGTEFSLPSVDKSLGFSRVAKYYYFPGWHQPASWNSFIMNKDVWNSYTPEQQAQFMTACRANVAWSMTVAASGQMEAIEEFKQQGVEVRRFPEPVLAALREASEKVVAEEAARDPHFKEALDSLNAYVTKVAPWYELQSLR
jgi:TRAP-type mannitol/chloroaromatic compound transport system substrate-binding protein